MCPLHAKAEHVCLIGRGNLDASVFLVGEAPGHREDDIGKPFSGRSGQLLDEVLNELGYPRESVYISNAVHCRPEDNKTPTPKEIKTCKIYLDRELNLVKPKVIVAMGNTALRSLTKRTGITKFRGNALTYGGNFNAIVVPTIHPAAVLRNPGHLNDLLDDLTRAFNIANSEVKYDKTDWKFISTLGEVAELGFNIQEAGICCFDIETNTLTWWAEDAKIASMGFSYENGYGYCLLLDHKDSPFSESDKQWIREFLTNTVFDSDKIIKVNQNVKFDMHFLQKYGYKFSGQIHDTMFLHYLLNENSAHDLETMVLEMTNYGEYWQEVESSGLHRGEAPNIDKNILGKYNATDADVTLVVFHNMMKRLEKEPKLLAVYNYLLAPALKCMFDAEVRGITVDVSRLEELKGIFELEIAKLTETLGGFTECKRYDSYMKKQKGNKWLCVNFNSYPQVNAILFKHQLRDKDKDGNEIKLKIFQHGFNVKPSRTTDKGNPSSDEESLINLIQNSGKVQPFARALLTLRKTAKLDGTYITGMFKNIATDNKVHARFRETGTKTGRMSCKDPNLQQIPRPEPVEYDTPLKAYVKGIFIPSDKKVFISADESQAEIRILTHYSDEPTFIKWFKSGKDVHEHVAAKMMRMSVKEFKKLEDYKARRKRAKTVNFGVVYKVGKHTLAPNLSSPSEGIIYTPEQAQEFLDEYFNMFPNILAYMEDMEALALEQGYVETLFGQKRRLPDVNSEVKSVREEALRQAVNSPIQGTAAQYTTFAMNWLHGHIDGKRKLPKSYHLLNHIHDDLLGEVRIKDFDETARIIKEEWENLPTKKYFGFKLKVPMVVEVSIGKDNWAKMEEVKV